MEKRNANFLSKIKDFLTLEQLNRSDGVSEYHQNLYNVYLRQYHNAERKKEVCYKTYRESSRPFDGLLLPRK